MSEMTQKSRLRARSLVRGTLFTPISFLWEWVYRIRRSFYEYGVFRKTTFKVPVISVGNISFGGTGKTPTIIWLADWLISHNLTPVVLTRGYKGQLENSSGLLKSGQKFRLNPFDYGDEPLMISNKMKRGAVIVGKRRAQNLLKYFSEVQPDVVLLDDGFQHLQIYRSFNILLFDASMPLNLYKVAPLGYLREGLSSLKDADAIVISRADLVPKEKIQELLAAISQHFHHQPLLALTKYHPLGVFDVHDKYIFSIHELKGLRAIAVTAIASPDSFYKYLENFGVEIVEKVSFSDHYFFTPGDVNELLIKASQQSCIILCSEKDMVKMKRVSLDSRILFTKVKVEFLSGETDLLKALRKVLHLEAAAETN
ncbi:MAG TPA: tetraacyldisaccharide 4'-kinase [Bacteriovoracaceae bacterium]|nr:tetraacyldisaccharide 4'-kinase [Bacteriovoracaceae bacterium]